MKYKINYNFILDQLILSLFYELFQFIKNHTGVDLRKVAFLIKHIKDKSSFEEFYQNSLAMRLFDYPSVDLKMEKIMIGIFKVISILYNNYSNLD